MVPNVKYIFRAGASRRSRRRRRRRRRRRLPSSFAVQSPLCSSESLPSRPLESPVTVAAAATVQLAKIILALDPDPVPFCPFAFDTSSLTSTPILFQSSAGCLLPKTCLMLHYENVIVLYRYHHDVVLETLSILEHFYVRVSGM